MVKRTFLAVGLAILGVGHVLFGFANFGFVETLPDDLNVAAEGTGALATGLALFWSAAGALRGTPSWRVLLLAGGFFVATMIVSIATGASDPPMLLVSLMAPVIALIGLSMTGRRKEPTVEHEVEERA